jgi:hypothetical protein
MDIQIPPQPSWVAALVGPPWPAGPEPNGSETAWWQPAAAARALKAQVQALVPDLARAPTELVDVLQGQTQQEALTQIAQLFRRERPPNGRLHAGTHCAVNRDL